MESARTKLESSNKALMQQLTSEEKLCSQVEELQLRESELLKENNCLYRTNEELQRRLNDSEMAFAEVSRLEGV